MIVVFVRTLKIDMWHHLELERNVISKKRWRKKKAESHCGRDSTRKAKRRIEQHDRSQECSDILLRRSDKHELMPLESLIFQLPYCRYSSSFATNQTSLSLNEHLSVKSVRTRRDRDYITLTNLRPGLVRKNFQDSTSHRIFGRMHRVLNIDENKN